MSFELKKEKSEVQDALVKCLCLTEAIDYLEQLSNVRNCIIIAAVKDTSGIYYDEGLNQRMNQLGFFSSLIDKHWCGYIGVVYNGENIFEQVSEIDEGISYEGIVDGISIKIKSSPFRDENIAEIYVNDIDYAVNMRGINLVIYERAMTQVVDSICIDAYVKPFAFVRKKIKIPIDQMGMINWLCLNSRGTENFLDQNQCFMEKEQQIVDLDLLKKKHEYRERILLSYLFPDIPNIINIKLFFDYNIYFWNSVQTLIQAFVADPRFNISVVFLGESLLNEKIRLANAIGAEGISFAEYNLEQDMPDIVIMTLGNDITVERMDLFRSCRNFSKLFLALPYTLIGHYETDFAERIGKIAPILTKFHLDYCFWDSLIYQKLQSESCDISHCVELGNPKFDAIYERLNRKNFLPDSWRKFRGKTVFLWATDHEWESNNCTFDQYAKTVFHYFYNHPEAGLVFRPHPVYINELRDNHLWTQQEIDQLKSYFSHSPNMIWDENPDYSLSYDTASAIITDVECGITVSALATKKPLCVFFRMGVPKHIEFPELIDNLYQVQSQQECIEFFKMIQRGEDPMKEQREQAFHNCICHFDGKNGQRMKDFIAEKYFEKYGTSETQE